MSLSTFTRSIDVTINIYEKYRRPYLPLRQISMSPSTFMRNIDVSINLYEKYRRHYQPLREVSTSLSTFTTNIDVTINLYEKYRRHYQPLRESLNYQGTILPMITFRHMLHLRLLVSGTKQFHWPRTVAWNLMKETTAVGNIQLARHSPVLSKNFTGEAVLPVKYIYSRIEDIL